VKLQLERVKRRVTDNYEVPFQYDQAVVDLIVSRCTELESGGRMIDAVLTNTMLPQISRELLVRTLENKPVQRVAVTTKGSEFEYAFD
jgi:type VI secretion system protein VasG